MHEWVVSPRRFDRTAARKPFRGLTYSIDAHRNHRGPYTAAGELVRAIVPQAHRVAPDLAQSHILTLRSIAPEVDQYIPLSAEVVRSFAFSREGNPRSWTRRLSHGLTDFLLTFLQRTESDRCAVIFENVHEAEQLDREFISIMLRRADPSKLFLQIGTSSENIDEPLLSSLKTYARLVPGEPASSSSKPPDNDATLAQHYIDSDCTSDDPLELAAYDRLDDQARRQLHLDRVQVLLKSDEYSLSLGAIPFHCERAESGMEHLLSASKYCMRMAYYHGSLDLAVRGLRLTNPHTNAKEHGEFTRNMLFALLLLGRLDEVKTLCEESEQSSDPAVRAHCTYAMAIMNARIYEPQRRDYEAARRFIEQSLAFTEMLPSSDTTVVNIAFLRNTLALVEMRQGRPESSISLLTDALEYLQRNAPQKYEVESPILLNNRARLHSLTGQPEKAIADYSLLLEYEPSNSEAHFDRGIIYQKLGRYSEALADYDAAILWSPPYPEAFFNRAHVYALLGRMDEALADYSYVLTLDPDSLNGRTNRACMLYERGDWDTARQDVEHALRLQPNHARLLCLDGLLKMKRGLLAEARESFDSALKIEPTLTDIWVNRAALSFKERKLDSALADLTHALSLPNADIKEITAGIAKCELRRRARW